MSLSCPEFSFLSVVVSALLPPKSLVKVLSPTRTWPSPWLSSLFGLLLVVLSALLSLPLFGTNESLRLSPSTSALPTILQRLPRSLAPSLSPVPPSLETWSSLVSQEFLLSLLTPAFADIFFLAYNEAIRPLYLAALIMSMLSLAFGIFTYDIHLGKNHNAIEKRETAIRSEDEVRPEIIAAKAKEVEEKIAAEVFGNEQLQAQAGYRDMSKLENSR